ncbi:uncharacterized protein [Taeniopygia guttata]|uniref:uncharacterized protein n=1 Tax=Taeniopygia guttata TaxID=59729 RepID=UPI003BB8D3DA
MNGGSRNTHRWLHSKVSPSCYSKNPKVLKTRRSSRHACALTCPPLGTREPDSSLLAGPSPPEPRLTHRRSSENTLQQRFPTPQTVFRVFGSEFIYNSVCSVRWDSRAQGLLIDRSLFERELLSPGDAQGPAPRPFRATRFRSFVRQLHRYGFHRVPGRAGSAAPGDAGAWLHYSNPCFRRDRPDLLLRVRRRSTPNSSPGAAAAGRAGQARSLPAAAHGAAAAAARRPPSGFHLLHRDRSVPARWEGPSRFQELYGQRPPPAEQEVLQIPPSDLLGFCGEPLLPLAGAQPRSRFQDLYGEQLPPVDRELLRMQPCSFQPLHREQQPPASVPQAALGTSAPSAPPGSAAASTASSSAQKAPGEEQLPPVDLGFAIEQMIQEIRRSLSERSPSAQGNINVVPESSEGEPVDRAAAEETPSGTESCGNSSPEPEEPDPV